MIVGIIIFFKNSKISFISKKNIIMYFNTLRKLKQLQKSDLDISVDIFNLFNNIKKLDDDNAIFDSKKYILKYFINS